jgi:SAM-dependent methyltransferase
VGKVAAAMPDLVCQICRSPRQLPYFEHEGRALLRCASCGFVHLHPLPTPDETAALYTDPYHGATTGYFAKVEKKQRRAKGRARQLAPLARPGGRFLDIGCSGGFMVAAMQAQGFEGHGLDLDREAVRYAAEHFPSSHFYNETVEEFARRGLGFDVLYSSEVIEHVVALDRFVGAIAALAAPDAVLYLTTPDISHWCRPRDLARWNAFCPPSHCVYFSPDNLQLLLDRHGFEFLRRRLSFKPGIKMFFRRRPG